MTTILSAVAIIALLWTTLSALPAGLEARMPLPYMIALTPLLCVPLMILAAVAAWQHEWTAMSLLIVVALIASSQRINYWGTSIDPAGKRKESHRETARETTSPTLSKSHNSNTSGTSNTSKEGPETISDGHRETTRETLSPQFSVMTMNCRYGRADAAEIIRNIRERNISVLALQEVTDDLITRLTEADINERLPYHQFGDAKETDNGGFNVIYSRYEPSAAVPNVVSIPAADVPAITLKTSGNRTVTLCSAHPKSPMRGCADWSAGILGLRELARAKSVSNRNIVVVMGDLNSSTDHPSFRALLKSGFKDASLIQAAGPNLTFPSWLKWPRIELDHVLFTPGLKPSGVKSFEVEGTDHLALTATLALR